MLVLFPPTGKDYVLTNRLLRLMTVIICLERSGVVIYAASRASLKVFPYRYLHRF